MVGNGAMANLRTIHAALPCRCPPGCDRDCAPPPTTTSGSVRSPRKSCHYGPRWACKCSMRASDISDGSSVQTQTYRMHAHRPMGSTESWPDPRRLHLQPAGAPHQVEFECHLLGRAELVGIGAHADPAIAPPRLPGAEALPFQPVDRVAGGMRLRDGVARQDLAPVVVVALAARQIELALAAVEQRTAGLEELDQAVAADRDRHAARLAPDEGRERQQLLALGGKRRRLLLLGAAD